MGRKIKPAMLKPEWPATPAAGEPAPHRYTWSGDGAETIAAEQLAKTRRQFLAVVPYKPGEIVFVADGDGPARRALILDVFAERDRFDDFRAKFRVAFEVGGRWSRQWVYTWAGFIQRGYLNAGLAPDLVGKL